MWSPFKSEKYVDFFRSEKYRYVEFLGLKICGLLLGFEKYVDFFQTEKYVKLP